MAHPFISLTPSQVRDQPKETDLTSTQLSLLTKVNTIVEEVRQRSPMHLTLPELQTIMDYKLAFGQNRPALRALIKKNTDPQVKDVSERAFAVSGEDWPAVETAMTILCELKGVGPATASLILSLLYPLTVPFFSDEATVDVLRPSGGRKGIKYTMKTYKALFEALEVIAVAVNKNGSKEEPILRGELERSIWHSYRLGEKSKEGEVGSSKRTRSADGKGESSSRKTKRKKS